MAAPHEILFPVTPGPAVMGIPLGDVSCLSWHGAMLLLYENRLLIKRRSSVGIEYNLFKRKGSEHFFIERGSAP
jgi:hypothetical protein